MVPNCLNRISEYANSQNKVNAADFFANHPYHIRREEFSRRLWIRPKEGELRQTKWFYERARGQYLDAQAHLTPAERKKFKGLRLYIAVKGFFDFSEQHAEKVLTISVSMSE
jgi:hypothetical protein